MRQRFGLAVLAVALLCIGSLQVGAQQTTVILVRHAEKAAAPASDPPLTEIGQARAGRLAEALANAGVSVIYATDTKRTTETAAPLAKVLGVEVIVAPTAGGAARYASDLAARIRRDHKGMTVLVVGHSNTTPDVIKALGAASVPPIADPEHDNLYVVTLQDDGRATVVRAKY